MSRKEANATVGRARPAPDRDGGAAHYPAAKPAQTVCPNSTRTRPQVQYEILCFHGAARGAELIGPSRGRSKTCVCVCGEAAPISILHGHLQVFVREPALLPAVLASLPLAPQNNSAIADIAQAAAQVLDAAAKQWPDKRFKSLCGFIFHTRHLMPAHECRQLQEIHTTLCCLRHTPSVTCCAFAGRVSRQRDFASRACDYIGDTFVSAHWRRAATRA